MKPKCNLTPEERERILPTISSYITEDEEDELRTYFDQYLFYWYDYETGKRQTYCSACGGRNRGVTGKIKHRERVSCMVCGTSLTAAAVNKYQYAMKSLAQWGRAAFLHTDAEGNLKIMTANVLRYFNHDDLRGTIELETRAKYYLAPGKVQMWEPRYEKCSGDGTWRKIPVPTKTVGEGFAKGWSYGFVITEGNYATIGLGNLENSSFRYCALEEYFEQRGEVPDTELCRGVISYLAQYAMHPQLEMVTKLRMREAVRDLIEEGRTNQKLLNWKARTPAGFLRMEKAEAKLFLGAGMDLDELRLYREACAGMRMSEYVDFRNEYRDGKEAELLLKAAEMAGVSVRRARKFASGFARNRRRELLREWIDYLDMAKTLGYDLAEETVAMPRDLNERHDRAVAERRYLVSTEKEKAYSRRLEKLRERYAFRTETLSVIVPGTLKEIVQEGQTLHHCVGGYAERHAEGKTCILFVRKTRTTERSFMTMELNETNMEIIQIHGYKNERYRNSVPPRIRYQDFLKTWQEWVIQGSRRDKAGHPILKKGIQTV